MTTATATPTAFEADFERSRRLTLEEVEGRPFWHKVASRASYLASPIQ